MLDENKVETSYRYLIATGLVSDKLIENASRKGFDFIKDGSYVDKVEAFLKRPKSKNDIAVFTTYAYADIAIPRTFDVIFDYNNVDNYVESRFTVVYSFNYAITFFYLFEWIDHGHRHICVLEFENEIPSILNSLPNIQVDTSGQIRICFCQKQDFEAIRNNLKRPKLTEG